LASLPIFLLDLPSSVLSFFDFLGTFSSATASSALRLEA
jgi:hypothetical protein